MSTVYDVTTWSIPGQPGWTAYTDIGAVINGIVADIHANQTNPSELTSWWPVDCSPRSALPPVCGPCGVTHCCRHLARVFGLQAVLKLGQFAAGQHQPREREHGLGRQAFRDCDENLMAGAYANDDGRCSNADNSHGLRLPTRSA
jgi:hypothetical protein